MGRIAHEEIIYERAKCAAFDRYEQAISWYGTVGCGATKAFDTGNWPAISLKGLRDRLAGAVINGEEHADKRILTVLEEVQLAKWLLKEENKAIKGKTRNEQKKHTEAVVHHHFFSPAGLKAEMKAAGVMDSCGLIDEWRLV